MKNVAIWNEILSSASKNLDPAEIEKWLRPLELSELRGDVITLSAPNKFFKAWVEDKYIGILKEAMKDNMLNAEDIKIIVKNDAPSAKPAADVPVISAVNKDKKNDYCLSLDKTMTFENFVVGTSNRFAYSACVAAAKGSFNSLYNPLYIYGDVGLGKTHLMQAAGNEMLEKFPKLTVIYTTGEVFCNEFVTALRNKTIEEFKAKYQNADVLLFDDVQMLAGKEVTAEQFFYNFSYLHAKEKRIIITSNAAPSEVSGLDKRLSSRFSAGFMIDVQYPSTEEREAIIYKRFEMLHAEVKPEVVRFLAENVKERSVRPIVGIITTLHTMAELNKQEITIEFAQSVLKNYLIKRDKILSPDEIVLMTASYFHLKPTDFKSKTRAASIAYPRSVAMYLLRQMTNLSLNEVGDLFGRDHSTVNAACKKIASQLETDAELKGTIERLLAQFKMNN